MGFFDTATFAEPVDGCYIFVNATNVTSNPWLSGVCQANSVRTNTTTAINIANLAWYTGKIRVNPTATEVSFELYDSLYSLVWNNTVTTNIPNTAGRETGFGMIATQNTTDAAGNIVQLDYMKLEFINRDTIIRQSYGQNATIKMSQEFLTAAASTFDPFLGTAISSGTVVANTGSAIHPGVVNITDSTTAQGGYRIMTDITAFLLYGNETASFIFKPQINNRNESFRFGFQDSTAINTMPTDGCYFNSSWNITSTQFIMGVCTNSSVSTNTTKYFLTNNTWYIGKIQVNSVATSVNFSIWNETNYMLWNGTVTTNIPVITGRETGFGLIAGEATTDAAKVIVAMDYMDLIINRTIYR
jgi:hypothetical protein